ncbi:VanZ family protein [Desulfobaculum xiamenense]|uniref:VanZ family protein n=1 Tax=Desulfobaculum xiamenense TaxID=995050 RepID=A0A846QVJ1_9BACT|nr:VanZ family protein [Desulfobaculum xiamenense]NJB68659.1 VanZ family protein [Desulfobaculum xiamenense]
MTSPPCTELRHHPLPWIAAALAYWAASAAGHDIVSQAYGVLFETFGRQTMEHALNAMSIASVAALAAVPLLGPRADLRRNATLWAALLVLAFALDATLIVTNVERIHFPQYAILGALLFAGLGDAAAVLVACALLGLGDEFAQFALNAHYTKYLDFNDCLLNLAGAAMGMVAARILGFGLNVSRRTRQAGRAVALALAGLTAFACAAALADGRFLFHHAPDGGFDPFPVVDGARRMVLSFVQSDGFWTVSEHGRRYHILSPQAGAALLAGLTALLIRLCEAPGASRVRHALTDA